MSSSVGSSFSAITSGAAFKADLVTTGELGVDLSASGIQILKIRNLVKKSPNKFALKTGIEKLNEIRQSEQDAEEPSPSAGSV